MMACASLGGALLPWTTGLISTAYRLRVGLLVPGVAIIALLLMGVRILWYTKTVVLRRPANPTAVS